MRSFIISIAIMAISLPAFSCRNTIPLSEAKKAVALEPNAGSKTCADLPREKCLCFDGVDWRETDLIDGELISNPDKKFARELAEKNREDSEKQKHDKCHSFQFKGATIAQLRSEMNEWLECKK